MHEIYNILCLLHVLVFGNHFPSVITRKDSFCLFGAAITTLAPCKCLKVLPRTWKSTVVIHSQAVQYLTERSSNFDTILGTTYNSSLVLTHPVKVHHTECYSSVTHHAILKRVFFKYILNMWKEKRGNETKLHSYIWDRTSHCCHQKSEECRRMCSKTWWTWNSPLGTDILSLIRTHYLICSLSLSLASLLFDFQRVNKCNRTPSNLEHVMLLGATH